MKVALYVWLIFSAATLPALALPFVPGAEGVTSALPRCEAKVNGSSCFLCGMTTAFYRIGEGRFSEAQTLNAGAVPLFIFFTLNAIAATVYGGKKCRF